MCVGKNMFADKHQLVHVHARKRLTRIFLYIQQGSINNYPYFLMRKKLHTLQFILKSASCLRELGNETYLFYHLYTFQFKKLKRF